MTLLMLVLFFCIFKMMYKGKSECTGLTCFQGKWRKREGMEETPLLHHS